ncbi:hypothetical protein ACLBXM_18355 [Xanthobacteraceae bacterium A53D]
MPDAEEDKNTAARLAVDLIRRTLDSGGDRARIVANLENVVLAIILANERIFNIARSTSLADVDAMFERLSLKLAEDARD